MALKDAPIVNMLSFDENEAYNHDRPISSLIRTQLLHLHTAENLWLPPEQRTNTNINELHTEKKASEYIQQVTRLLHGHGARQQQVPSRAKSKKARKPAKPRKKAAGASRRKATKTRATSAKKKPSRKKRSSRR